MGFLDVLQAELGKESSGRGTVDHPSKQLKHKPIYLGAKNPEIFVRILPPAVEGDNYAEVFREAMCHLKTTNNKILEPSFVLSEEENPNDPLDMAISKWVSEGRMPNRLGGTTAPSLRAYINVRQIVANQATGNWEEEKDEFGAPVTRMVKLPISAYWSINKLLADGRYAPVNSDDYSFISSLSAYPVAIKRGSGNGYEANVLSNMPLGPLEPTWKETLEDLKAQAQPAFNYDGDFIDYFIKEVEASHNMMAQGNPMFGGQQQVYGMPQQQGYGMPQQQGYGNPQQPGFGNPQQPGFGNPQQPGFGNPQQPGFGNPQQPGFGNPQQQGFGNPQQPGFGNPQQPGFGNPQQPGFGMNPQTQQPVQPPVQQPVQPPVQQPVQPPVQHAVQQPEQQQVQPPVQHAVQQPEQHAVQQPEQQQQPVQQQQQQPEQQQQPVQQQQQQQQPEQQGTALPNHINSELPNIEDVIKGMGV